MAKLKLSKNELKKQKEAFSRFSRYLPMLQLKKQQLRIEVTKSNRKIEKLQHVLLEAEHSLREWVDVFAENIDITQWCAFDAIITGEDNVAGIDIPAFKSVRFKESEIDAFNAPYWVEAGIDALKDIIALKAQILVCQQQQAILRNELRIITQRVNLFEKIKIPQTKENIRKIRIYLGDLFTAEVVRGKIAKSHLEQKTDNA